MSATPSPFELEVSSRVVEQIVGDRVDGPAGVVRPTKGQIDDLVARSGPGGGDQRVLVTR